MGKSVTYHHFPFRTVFLSNAVSLSIYTLGFIMLFKLGLLYSLLFLAYLAVLEYRLLRYHCTNCWYWGKSCGFGKGRLSALFFKKGNPSKFCSRSFTWQDMIPDILVTLIPMITGIILLIIRFDIFILSALILLALLTTSGNSYIRGKLTCRHCKQKELGCPAAELFRQN